MAGHNRRRLQRGPVRPALGCGFANVHVARLYPTPATTRSIDADKSVRHCSVIRDSWAPRVNVPFSKGSAATNFVGNWPGQQRFINWSSGGTKDLPISSTNFGVATAPRVREAAKQNAKTIEVVGMPVRLYMRYICVI